MNKKSNSKKEVVIAFIVIFVIFLLSGYLIATAIKGPLRVADLIWAITMIFSPEAPASMKFSVSAVLFLIFFNVFKSVSGNK